MSEWNRVGVIEKERCNVPCDFRDGISRDEFSAIAYNVMKRMTRVRKIEFDGGRIRGLAESHSGRSTWWFMVDFNNWGHVTGTRWTWSQKEDSNLAEKYGDYVADEIKLLLKRRNITAIDYSELIDADKNLGTIHGLKYKKKFCVNKKEKIVTGMDSVTFIHEHVYAVIAFLKKRGFCNIKSVKSSYCSDFAGCVNSISINGIKTFDKDDKFCVLDEVVIEYCKGNKRTSLIGIKSSDKGMIVAFLILVIMFGLILMISFNVKELW